MNTPSLPTEPPDEGPVECATCGGRGLVGVVIDKNGEWHIYQCRKCKGEGYITTERARQLQVDAEAERREASESRDN